MDEAELVGGVLYDADDPMGAATVLTQLLTSEAHDHHGVRRLGFEPALVESLRHALPRDPHALELACVKGAAWVLGRRSAARPDGWDLVASVPTAGELPAGLRRTTAETLIALIGEAERSLRFAAPYVDRSGMRIIAETLAIATGRGVEVEVFEPKRWAFGVGATEELRQGVGRLGDPTKLRMVHLATDAPWPHLKVMVADGRAAYIGSANITAAALMGRNLELGVLVRGPDVAVIDRVLDLSRESP